MALRDQPYIPLYVQDFLTDEKLNECSASATGVYIKVMCLMHKSEPYGVILLKQKHKQTDKQIKNFALKLAYHLPYDLLTIESAISELVDEGVLIIEGDSLIQKRMVRDNEISVKRAESGSKGGKKTQGKAKDFALSFAKAKSEANPENESEYENEDENNKKSIRKNKFIPPTLKQMETYFDEKGYSSQHAKTAFDYYTAGDWHDSKGSPVRNWKQKCISIWFKDEGKKQEVKLRPFMNFESQ